MCQLFENQTTTAVCVFFDWICLEDVKCTVLKNEMMLKFSESICCIVRMETVVDQHPQRSECRSAFIRQWSENKPCDHGLHRLHCSQAKCDIRSIVDCFSIIPNKSQYLCCYHPNNIGFCNNLVDWKIQTGRIKFSIPKCTFALLLKFWL